MTLIERLEAVVARLEALESERYDQSRLIFSGGLPVLLDDGRIKLHGLGMAGPVSLPTHTSDDECAVLTIEDMKALEGMVWA